ncbi:uncharacterized protein LOC122390723 [Amphibalanus amphitrite]|uniref:uncharacterized protein LOC122390723 n=1 Tax=Amphibalanus amphitrite TaxID=1232801 RepID=UPI001C9240E2|nr:uncharacterized protein LOC122390723 [Amphibalanus amphitrite]
MNASPTRPFPPGWNPMFPPIMPYPGFFGPGINPIWLQAFQAARRAKNEAAAAAVTTEAPTPDTRPASFSAQPEEPSGRRKRQAGALYPAGLYPGPVPGRPGAALPPGTGGATAPGQRTAWGNQVDARVRCVLSDLGLVGRDRELDSDDLHKLIDGIVTDEQSKKRLTSISDACFKQSTKSSHSLAYYLTHPHQDSQETVYVKCILGKLDHACQKEYTDKYNPMKAEMLRLKQARCLLSDLRPDGQVLFKTISCVGETFQKVSQAFASETRTATVPLTPVAPDTCRREPFLFDPVVALLKLPPAFSATAERLAVQQMVQCVLSELGVFASFAAPLSAPAVTKVVDGMQGTILAKNKLKEASARCIIATPQPKDKAELVGYINCVLDFLGDDCPNYSRDTENASFFEIIPTFLGERPPTNGTGAPLRPLPGIASLSTQRPTLVPTPPGPLANTTEPIPVPPGPQPGPQPTGQPPFFGDPLSAAAGPFSAGFGSFGGLSGMPSAPSPLSAGLPPELSAGGGPLGFSSLAGLVRRVKRQRGQGRQPRGQDGPDSDGGAGARMVSGLPEEGRTELASRQRNPPLGRAAAGQLRERPTDRAEGFPERRERHTRTREHGERAVAKMSLGRVEIRPI